MTEVTIKLVGECSRCGACCSGTWIRRSWVCEHLIVDKPIGTPEATTCARYAERRDGMPIRWLDPLTREPIGLALCWKDSEAETHAIIAAGIGKGCSLTVQDVPA